MKPSFKTTTLIATIGMIVYTLFIIIQHVAYEFFIERIYYDTKLYATLDEIITRLLFDILPISLIIACIALYKQRPIISASKPFHMLTIGIFIALVCTPIFTFPYFYIEGMPYLYPSTYWRILMLIAGIIWLFMLRKQPTEEASPRSYRMAFIIAVCILALPIVMEIISGLSLLINGNILSFRSAAIKTWVRWTAPILPLIHFVFPNIQRINYTRNSHCTPGSFDERTFKRHRIITIVFVCLFIISAEIHHLCFSHLIDLYLRLGKIPYLENTCNSIRTASMILGDISFVSGCISWIMLSIMAFRQLPNPRGYKIYNIACQCLTWGNLMIAIILTIFNESIAETFAQLSVITFLAFFITQTVRVIAYKLPIDNN